MKRAERTAIFAKRNADILQEWRDRPTWIWGGAEYVGDISEREIAKKYKIAHSTLLRIIYKQLDLESLMDAIEGKFK